jgi:soluble lytic murein transglycosylase
MKFLFVFLLFSPLLAAANQDADFLAAREAFRVGKAARLDALAVHFKGAPLEPYLTSYQLRMGMSNTDGAAIRTFLARSDATPVIDQLRVDWLKQLGKQRQWTVFLAEYPRVQNTDTELLCWAMQAQILPNHDAEARRIWLSGRPQPDSCEAVFDVAIANGGINEAAVWARLRLALEASQMSLAKQIAARLPSQHAPTAAGLDSAFVSPAAYLARLNWAEASEGAHFTALFAMQRYAKLSPQAAYTEWGQWAANFSPDEQHYFYGWLAYEAARKLDARALDWYKLAANVPLNEAQLAWRARAALRQKNWAEVWASVSVMSPSQQRESAWRYWKARALKEMGNPAEANVLWAELSREYSFYGQLAGEELGAVLSMDEGHYLPSEVEIQRVQSLPAVQRAMALYRMDLRVEAAKEWAWTMRTLDDKSLLAAAEVARRNEMYDRAINAADRTVQIHDFKLRYLAPYREELAAHIRDNRLDEAWVYGLMRQESRFVTQAKSDVGAAGLMQVMPATARWIAKKLGLKSYKAGLIDQLDTNLKLGTYYMKNILTSLDNNLVLASAAYNAGPSRAKLWRGEVPLEGAIYAETIPFDETRDYVKKVLSNTSYYAKLFEQPSSSLKQRLGVIAPRKGAATPSPVDLLPEREDGAP